MELITSPLISAPHGFPTRAGGVSQGAFATLNCAASVGDEPSAVEENLRRVATAAGVAPGALITVSQVHGETLLRALSAGIPGKPLGEADAVWTDAPGLAVGVRTADCLPILLHDPVGHRVAAVHAGWRGVIADLVTQVIAALSHQGSRAQDLRVVVGPCIQRCCFEVDGDLPDRFRAAFGPEVVVEVPGKARRHLDLPRAVLGSLERAGVDPSHVAALPQCTRCDERFFSHRRDQGKTGRHLSFITCQ